MYVSLYRPFIVGLHEDIHIVYLTICCNFSVINNSTRVIPKVMSNHFLHANQEQQMKENMVVDGTSCCVILECLVMSIACIT